jgi:thioredoxin 1
MNDYSDVSTPIVHGIENRHEFENILKENQGVIILKFQAEWCGPCQKIKPFFDDKIKNHRFHKCYIIDVDENFEIYAYLKYKKMIKSIPVILAYYKGNHTFACDDSVIGSDTIEINDFFNRCVLQNEKSVLGGV